MPQLAVMTMFDSLSDNVYSLDLMSEGYTIGIDGKLKLLLLLRVSHGGRFRIASGGLQMTCC